VRGGAITGLVVVFIVATVLAVEVKGEVALRRINDGVLKASRRGAWYEIDEALKVPVAGQREVADSSGLQVDIHIGLVGLEQGAVGFDGDRFGDAAHFEVQIDTGGGANKNVNALLGERSEASGADREVVVSLWQVLNGVVACIVCGNLPEQTGGRVRRGHRCFGDNGAGRVADIDSLDLAAGNVAAEHGRIALDPRLRSTSNPGVYVCGDAVATTPQLSPIATYEGRIVGRNIADGPLHVPDYASIPSCVFTVPALASVGLTQAAAEDKGIAVRAVVNDMHEWLSGRTYAEHAAWAKVLIEERTDRIIGAHIFGHAGEELIHLFALAMKHGITASQIRDLIYGFPTFSADIKSMM